MGDYFFLTNKEDRINAPQTPPIATSGGSGVLVGTVDTAAAGVSVDAAGLVSVLGMVVTGAPDVPAGDGVAAVSVTVRGIVTLWVVLSGFVTTIEYVPVGISKWKL
jgi:hypothetical protein